MPWLRLWVDILDDLDLHELSDGAFRAWTLLLAAAKKHDRDGLLPGVNVLVHWMRRPRKTVERWLAELVAAGKIDQDGDDLTIHGWARWQEPRDRTNAQRQARFKAARKHSPHPPLNTRAETDTHTRPEGTVTQTPLPESGNGTVTALPACEGQSFKPFDYVPIQTFSLPSALPPDKRRVLDRQTERFGASNGDRVIGDLLKDFSAEVVSAACDHHYHDNNGGLDPRRLLGICRAMHAGTWKLPPKGKQGGPENQPAKSAPDVLARIEAELAKRPKISPKDFDGGKRVG